jgi:hypothetical protein
MRLPTLKSFIYEAGSSRDELADGDDPWGFDAEGDELDDDDLNYIFFDTYGRDD